MAKAVQITKWESSDGQQHETEQEARERDAYIAVHMLAIKEFGNTMPAMSTASDVAQWAVDNRVAIAAAIQGAMEATR